MTAQIDADQLSFQTGPFCSSGRKRDRHIDANLRRDTNFRNLTFRTGFNVAEPEISLRYSSSPKRVTLR
jgi:hypothetical protein